MWVCNSARYGATDIGQPKQVAFKPYKAPKTEETVEELGEWTLTKNFNFWTQQERALPIYYQW
jgi:hypothetical protein